MRISALIGDDVVFVGPNATVIEVIDALTANEIGIVAVGTPDRPLGVVSERDVVRALSDQRALDTTLATDIATKELVWCDETSSVREVAAEMMDHYVRHVLVEANGRLVGIVSARDLLGYYAATPS